MIDFPTDALAAEALWRFDKPDGSVMHAEVRVDDTVVMIAAGGDQTPSFPVWPHVYVLDVDASYRRALKAGGVSAEEPHETDAIDRRAGVRDPVGNTWWMATRIGKGER